MQEQLKNFINEIKFAKMWLKSYDEPTTKQVIIQKILVILGWDIFRLEDVQPEYPVDEMNTKEKVDYALSKNTDTYGVYRSKSD